MRRVWLVVLAVLVLLALPAIASAQGQNFPSPCPGGINAQVVVTAAASITLPYTAGSCETDFLLDLNQNVTITAVTGTFNQFNEIIIFAHQNAPGNFTLTLPANFLNVPTLQATSGLDTITGWKYCGAAGQGNACPAGDWQGVDVGSISSNTGHTLSAVLVCAAASASGTAYTCSTSPTFTPADGDTVLFEADVANTGAATLAVNGAAAKPLKKQTSTALIANDILVGQHLFVVYDGTNWQMLMPGNAAFISQGTTAGFVDYPQGPTSVAVTPCNAATSICEQAPTAVTSYLVNKPGVAASGTLIGTNAAAVITQGFSGDSNHSATVTTGSGTSIGSTSLCSTTFCPAGTYRVNVYIDITTACGTTGTYIVNLIWTDDTTVSKTAVVNLSGAGSVPQTGVLTTTATTNFGQDSFILRSTGTASINYSTTATACGSAGPMVGKLYLSVEPVQ